MLREQVAIRTVDPAPVASMSGLDDGSRRAAERALLEGLRRGDSQSAEEFVRRYGAGVLAVTRRLLRNEEDARDASQEAFFSAFRSIHQFREGAGVATWLYRIATNSALMRIRAASRRPEVSTETLPPAFDEDGHHSEPVHAWAQNPQTAVLRQETRAAVRSAIERLPVGYRTVLLLRDIEERTTEEVAEVLGVSENAVKVRLHRARRALLALLDPAMAELGS